MSSQGLLFILTMLAVIPCGCAPIMLAFQFGLVFSWWGQDAEAFFGLLLLLGLAPMIIAAGVAVILFFHFVGQAHWQRWLLNGVTIGLFTGAASLLSIELGEAWTGPLAMYILVSSVATCGLGLLLLVFLNRMVDRIRHA